MTITYDQSTSVYQRVVALVKSNNLPEGLVGRVPSGGGYMALQSTKTGATVLGITLDDKVRLENRWAPYYTDLLDVLGIDYKIVGGLLFLKRGSDSIYHLATEMNVTLDNAAIRYIDAVDRAVEKYINVATGPGRPRHFICDKCHWGGPHMLVHVERCDVNHVLIGNIMGQVKPTADNLRLHLRYLYHRAQRGYHRSLVMTTAKAEFIESEMIWNGHHEW